MKRFIISLMVAFIGLAGGISYASSSSSGVGTSQSQLTQSETQQMINVINSELPQQIEDGITWKSVELTNNNTTLQMTMDLTPAAYPGLSVSEVRNQFAAFSKAELRGFLGEEFMQIGTMTGKKMALKLLFSGKDALVLDID